MIESDAQPVEQTPSRLIVAGDSIYLLITLGITIAVMVFLFYFEQTGLPIRQLYRFAALLPVCLFSYRYGTRAGVLSALFFSTAFLPQLFWTTQGNFWSNPTKMILATVLFITAFAYVIGDISRSIRTHEALSSAVRDWRALLARTSALDEVIKFILEQSCLISNAEMAAFLLRNPLDAQWEVITLNQHIPLPLSGTGKRERVNLAEWLLDQEKPLVLNNLDKKSSFIASEESASGIQLRSLLAQPLHHHDGTLMGMLVLINRQQGDFSRSDLQSLDELASGGERALEQAGLYARTDYALARRVRQLAAIQRTARELNATLDPRQIIERTLTCALEITDGEAGFINLDMKGFPPIFQTSGANLDAGRVPLLANRARDLDRAAILSSEDAYLPTLLPQASSRLVAPIKRENLTLGLVIVESSSPRIFKEASRHVLTILADHAAIALENARLFQEIHMEQQRVSLIIHSIADGLLTTDSEGTILTFNPAAELLTGWTAAESLGRSCCEVFGCQMDAQSEPGTCPDCSVMQAVHEQSAAYEARYVIRQRSGTKRVISLSIAPLPASNDRPAGSVFLFRDITAQDEMDRLQRELIAAISHELRAPLSHISSIVETLLDTNDSAAIQPYQKYLLNLMTQTHRLAGFADRILDIYRMETGQLRMQLRPLPASLIVEDLVRTWQPGARNHNLVSRLPEKSPWIWADETSVKTVLNNLVENAVKYSPANTRIEISVEPGPDGCVTLAVRDQGPGIAAEHQSKVFQRFYRVDGRDAQTVYGHGLGLYIAKNLVEAMKGQIWVESEPEKGSCFAFFLPSMEANNEGKDFSD